MPNFDQTGPQGQGPMTGRRMGRCTNFGSKLRKQRIPESENQINPINENLVERGFGLGRGRGGLGRGMGQKNRFRGGV